MDNVVSLRTVKYLVTAALVTGLAGAAYFPAHTQAMQPLHVFSQPTDISSNLSLKVKAAAAQSPMAFEANTGQTDKQVRYFVRGQGYSLFLTPTKAVFDFQQPPISRKNRAKVAAATSGQHEVMTMQLVGAEQHPAISGVDELPGKANYFHGSDPKKWHTNVPTFDKVRYRSVYPGIDLLYYGNQQRLEYDFIVAPHSDPNRIAFTIRGARHLTVDTSGNLIVSLPKGEIRWHKPVLYQEKQGQRKTVSGRYRVHGNQIAFAVSRYDVGRPLVIDPQLVYSTYLGGTCKFHAKTRIDSA